MVGTGQGAFQLAASLRDEGFIGAITLIGEEPGLPYQRPPLSKAYLDEGRDDRLLLRPESFYARQDIALIPGERVVEIDRGAQRVVTRSGTRHTYDHLVLATGARNARPPIAGAEAPGVLGLRSLADARALRAAMATAQSALVIGGGFIGLEFAAVARAAGRVVTVLEAGPRLMARAVSAAVSARFLDLHLGMGTQIVLGAPVAAILTDGTGRAAGARLLDGTEHRADLVLLATGVRPNTELAEAAGLSVANGILTDVHLLTSDPAISALGDCAAVPQGDAAVPLRLESVQAATDQARAIARRLTGNPAPYTAVPWFWSDQGTAKLQIAGLTAGATETERIYPEPDRTVVFCYRMGHLAGVETINAPGDHMAARTLLALQPGITRAELAERGHDIRAMAKAAKEARS